MGLKMFIDADGTFTRTDAGNVLFGDCGGALCDGLRREFEEGRLTAVQYFRSAAEVLCTVQRSEIEEALLSHTLDPTFKRFVGFCRERGLEFHIVSDGLDYSIERILAANDVAGVSVIANRAVLSPSDNAGKVSLGIEFPYTDAECDRCACCRRNAMLTLSGDDDIIVYVGAGESNACPVRYADVVFARGALQAFCQKDNISYYQYDSFEDVVLRLRELLGRRRLHKRLKAEHLRREAFLSE
jgi:2-hydroxy-3-keto-5-methylthiopentenyl-1-phosphate phosphatase